MLRRKSRWRHRFCGLLHFASAVKPLGKMAARQNRVASVFFVVASHAAETPPPRPRKALLTGSAAILAAFWTLYLHRGSFAAIQILPRFHRSIGAIFGIMLMFRESGAMAQRGEIQCAESQFALQSSRRWKCESFKLDDTWQRTRNSACLSLCFQQGNLTASIETRREVFYILDSC